MNTEIIVAIVGALLGGSGIGAAIVSAIANRQKTAAQATMTLSAGYEVRLAKLTERACQLEARIDTLEGQVSSLKSGISERDATIVNLQQENVDLQDEINKLRKAVSCRDSRIKELERQVVDLTKRLDAMNGKQDGSGE